MVDAIGTRMPAREYFELPETTELTELLDGEVIVRGAPTYYHQRLVRELARLVEQNMPNGEVLFAPLDVYFDEDNVPQPDVVWVTADSRCTITPTRLVGPPDLIAEVLSPSTAHSDKKAKFDLYQRFGVREYWLVDPDARLLEAYSQRDGTFARVGAFGADDAFPLPLLGTLDLRALFAA